MDTKPDRIVVDDEFITINGPVPYEIPWKQCRSAAEIVSWVYHLTEKNWIDRLDIRKIIEIMSKRRSVNLGP